MRWRDLFLVSFIVFCLGLIFVINSQAKREPYNCKPLRGQGVAFHRCRTNFYASWVRHLLRQKHQQKRMVWNDHVNHALKMASVVYRVPYWQLKKVGRCESGLWPFARNGQYRGLFQEGPMFERGPFGRAGFSVWDPWANAFTAAYTVSRGGWSQWECKP